MRLFTPGEFNLEMLKDLNLRKREFAEIGENQLIRLLALDGSAHRR